MKSAVAPPTISVARRFWRMLSPRWAHQPPSGKGAARQGGRYNPPGVPALYMFEDFVTAIAEYEQDLGIRPGTLCAYQVDLDGIVDLTDADARAAVGVEPSDLIAPWKTIALIDGKRPPTWTLPRG